MKETDPLHGDQKSQPKSYCFIENCAFENLEIHSLSKNNPRLREGDIQKRDIKLSIFGFFRNE